jgi:hypothetical protein
LVAKISVNFGSAPGALRSMAARLCASRQETGKPLDASFCAPSTQRAKGSLPQRRTISDRPRTSPGTATARPPCLDSSGSTLPFLV